MVELSAEIVASDEQRQAVAEQVLLEPGLLEAQRRGRLKVADALDVPNLCAGRSPVRVEQGKEYARATPPDQPLQLQRDLRVPHAERRHAAANAAGVPNNLPDVRERGRYRLAPVVPAALGGRLCS